MYYTDKELSAAADIIRRIACEHHVSEDKVRVNLLKAMNAGRDNPDPAVQARWEAFRYAGAEPTVEEFILWCTNLTRGRIE